jgi:hypothetical protein
MAIQPVGTGSTSVRQGFSRETHASRGKDVRNPAAKGRIVSAAGRLTRNPITARATRPLGVVPEKPLEQATGGEERSVSRMTTDTMDSDAGDMVRQAMRGISLQQTVSSPIHSTPLHSTTLPIEHVDSRVPAQKFLEKNGWRVDDDQSVLICLQCGCIINPEKVREHVMDFHPEVKPERHLQARFMAACGVRYNTLTFHPAHPLSPVRVIAGLKLQESMQICSFCNRGFGCDKDRDPRHMSRSFRKHTCKRGEENGDRGFSVCPAQRFGQNFSWFAVIPDGDQPIPLEDIWHEYQSKQASRTSPSSNAASIPDDYRVLNQFLLKERWLEHVRGLDGSVAIELSSCSTKDAVFGSLPHRIHAFLAKYQAKSNSHFLQRLIGIRPGAEHGQNHPRHHRAVNYDAHVKYSRCIAGALALLLRNVVSPSNHYRFEVPQKISQVARELYGKLQANTDVVYDSQENYGEESNMEEPDSDDEDDYPDGEALPTVSPDVALDDDTLPAEGELAEDPAVEDAYPYGMSETREVPTFEDETQVCILRLLQLLYTQNLNDGPDNPFKNVFVRYVVLSSMRQSGQWRLASVITQVIAAILFGGRLTVAKIMLELKSSRPGTPLSM